MIQSDVDFLFWYAVAKARVGAFDQAGALFHAIEQYHEDAPLGRAYCFVRQGQYRQAHALLGFVQQPSGRAYTIYKRLLRRCEQEIADANE